MANLSSDYSDVVSESLSDIVNTNSTFWDDKVYRKPFPVPDIINKPDIHPVKEDEDKYYG